jgi:undecaprenyl-diphosphatase
MTSLVDHILNVPVWLAILIVFLLPALESSIFVGFIFPGETAVVLGGVLASEHKVALWIVFVAASVGAVLGDSVGYYVGRRWGHRLLERAGGRLLKRSQIDKAVGFVARRGGPGIFIGRFTTVLRVLVPGVAGMAEMRYRRFLIFNATGGIAWSIVFATIGFVAGKSFARVEKTASTAGLVVVGAVVVLLLLYGLYRYLKEFRKEPA